MNCLQTYPYLLLSRAFMFSAFLFLAMGWAAPSAHAGLGDGLLAYWQFDGNGLDSANDFDVDLVENPGFDPAGLFGQGLSLDGTNWAARPVDDDEFDFDDRDFTIQVWAKFTAEEGVRLGGIAIDKFTPPGGPGWTIITLDPNQDVAVFSPDMCYCSTGVISPDFPGPSGDAATWHHIVLTGDFDTITLYVDGVVPASSSNPLETPGGRDFVTGSSEPLYIGRRTVTDTRPNSEFGGVLDEVAIWNRALSGAEIATLYNNGDGQLVLPGQGVDGDANGDGIVNATDLSIVAANWNTIGGRSEGDFGGGVNGEPDGVVTQADLDILGINWYCDASADPLDPSACTDFTPDPSPTATGVASASVPEPSSILLATAGLLGFLLAGRRRRMVTR